MTLLRLDYQPNNPLPWVGVALLGVAVVALILTGTYYYKLNDKIASLDARVERTKDKRAQRSSERGGVELAQEVKNANDVLRRLSVPWESLFQAVESSGNQNITLLAIEPDIEKQQVKIGGEAKNFGALMKYITHLQGQVVFGSVYLQNHDVQQQDPDKPVRFSLLAAWQDKS
jgi:Fimbrial assembly protein (PilN)